MAIYSAYNTFFFSFPNLYISLLWCVLLQLLPTGGNCLTNRARLSLLHPKNVELILFLNWIHTFVSELAVANSGVLVYARQDTLGMAIWCLQVYWEGSKIVFFHTICLLFAGRVFYLWKYLSIGFFPWPNNSTTVGLVQPELAQILVWQPYKQAQAPVSAQQCWSWTVCQH